MRRQDECWLLDGLLSLDELQDQLDIRPLPRLGRFQTVGGFVHASHIPRKAERHTWHAWEFEAVDGDRNRVDQGIASRAQPAAMQAIVLGFSHP